MPTQILKKSMQFTVQRIKKLEEVYQQLQLQIIKLQEKVVKQEDKLKKQEEHIFKLERYMELSQCNNSYSRVGQLKDDVATMVQNRAAINDGDTLPVAFSAWLNNELVDVSNEHLIKMTDVKLNEGNGYNSNDGIFFCPRSGLYLFQWSAMPPSGKGLYLQLMVNGISYATIHANSNPSFQSSSNLALVRLNAGDHVLLESIYTSSFHANYCSFSGVWLSN